MQCDAARSFQLIENLAETSGVAEAVKACHDPYLKASLRPATATKDFENAEENALAELDFLINSLTTRLDFLKKLLPDKTRKNVKKTEPTYCTCQREAFGDMVGCDDPECPYEWYHLECVGITVAPKGKWLCPTCRERIGLKSPEHRRR